jgi:hypothetical protein
MASKREKEKKRQKKMKFLDRRPLVLKKRNARNKSNRRFISMAAARESICLTSLG